MLKHFVVALFILLASPTTAQAGINDAVSEELLGCHTPDELAIWIRRDALAWQAEMDIAIFRKSLPWMNTFLFEQSTCSYFLWCQSICSQLGNQALMMKYKF